MADPVPKVINIRPAAPTEPTAPRDPEESKTPPVTDAEITEPTKPKQPSAPEQLNKSTSDLQSTETPQSAAQAPSVQQIGVANRIQNVVIRNQVAPEKPAEYERPWSTGLCDCCSDCETCCFGLWCMPCLLFNVADRLSESWRVPFLIDGGLLALRTKLRVKYNIQGSICNDYCIVCCCATLAVCQMNRELDHVGL